MLAENLSNAAAKETVQCANVARLISLAHLFAGVNVLPDHKMALDYGNCCKICQNTAKTMDSFPHDNFIHCSDMCGCYSNHLGFRSPS